MEPVNRARLGSQSGNHLPMSANRGPLGTAVALITGTALIALGLAFSLVVVTAVAVVGTIGFSVLWWKTRSVRKQLRKQIRQQMETLAQNQSAHARPYRQATPADDEAVTDGVIIEGEVIHEEREPPN